MFKVAIRVPTRTDLYIRLTAGELRVSNVRGNTDVVPAKLTST